MDVSLYEINRTIGELVGAMKMVEKKVDEQTRRFEASERSANESRANVHRRLDDMVERASEMEMEVSDIKRDVETVMRKVDEHEQVTIQIKTMRDHAAGAGTLGRWLIRFGGWVVGAASAIGMAYTWLTGRPPP